jgi:DNA-binding HxlR family transcriptional regulator
MHMPAETTRHAVVGECAAAPSPRLACALSLLQEKWTLFILHALMSGPLGFNETGRTVGPVNTTTLSQRLSRLEHAGLVRKTIHSTMPPRTSYELTEAGRAFRPVLAAIAQWSEQHMPEPPPDCATAASADPDGSAR